MIAGDRNAWCFVKGADEIGSSKVSKVYDFGEVLTRKSENVTGGDLTVTVKTADTLTSATALGSDAKEIAKYVVKSADLKSGATVVDTIIDHSMTRRYLQITFTGSAALTGKVFAEVSSDAK